MSLKIIIDTPADNGNRFLCPDCTYSRIRSGTSNEQEIQCRAFGEGTASINFRVTKCDSYESKSMFETNTPSYRRLTKEAWLLQNVKGKITFVAPDSKNYDPYS